MGTVSRRFALWQADLDGAVCAAPEECVETLRDRGPVPVVLEHRYRGVTPTRQVFESALVHDVEWQLTGIVWPPDLHPGVLVTVTWRTELHVRTTALDEPMRVDGVPYYHEYDPKVVTREYTPDASNRARVLNAVRRQGRVFDDGSAVLADSQLAALSGFGRGARNAFLLRNAVDQLIREGFLTRVDGSVDSSGYPSYPAAPGQKPAGMLFYAPLVEPAPYGDDPDADEEAGSGERQEHWVNAFVRRLPPGAQPSPKQVSLHENTEAEPLPPGYTFVKRHHRNG